MRKTQTSKRAMVKMAWAVFLYLGNWEKSRPSLTVKSNHSLKLWIESMENIKEIKDHKDEKREKPWSLVETRSRGYFTIKVANPDIKPATGYSHCNLSCLDVGAVDMWEGLTIERWRIQRRTRWGTRQWSTNQDYSHSHSLSLSLSLISSNSNYYWMLDNRIDQ